jgi:DsbC/DsbD-like thiol-disulfide interchange protein
MRAKIFNYRLLTRGAVLLVEALMLLLLPASGHEPAAHAHAALQSENVGVNGFYSLDKAQRGRVLQAAIVVDIPGGYHINANRLIGKIGVPTSLKVEAPGGIRVGPIIYPRPVVRKLKFSDERLALYEGRAVLRFNVSIPSNHGEGMTELRARLRYQACNDEVCFPPTTREVTLPIGVVGPNDSVRHINGNIFGRRK